MGDMGYRVCYAVSEGIPSPGDGDLLDPGGLLGVRRGGRIGPGRRGGDTGSGDEPPACERGCGEHTLRGDGGHCGADVPGRVQAGARVPPPEVGHRDGQGVSAQGFPRSGDVLHRRGRGDPAERHGRDAAERKRGHDHVPDEARPARYDGEGETHHRLHVHRRPPGGGGRDRELLQDLRTGTRAHAGDVRAVSWHAAAGAMQVE